METLINLQNRIYKQNVEMGWHDSQRSFNTFICLFHSELSEAMEGIRKNSMDDHLPEYRMFNVEIADFSIRCMDWLASVYYSDYNHAFEFHIPDVMTDIDLIAYLHHSVSMALDSGSHEEVKRSYIASAVKGCFDYADNKGWSLLEIINKKLDYNKHRQDHKRESRDKPDGKKF